MSLGDYIEYSISMKKSQVKKEKNENVFFDDGKKFFVDEKTGEVFEVLHDVSGTGKVGPWREHKVENSQVEKVYRLVAQRVSAPAYWEKKADRLRDCGSRLTFGRYCSADGTTALKAKHLASCRVRLCPLCAWRRSLKVHSHVRKILEAMQTEQQYAYLLLTLTVRNVTGDKLSAKLTDMLISWNRLLQHKPFKKAVRGWYRGLEVTHNVNRKSKSFDTYHPHFHCILAVDKGYFTSRDYINQKQWLAMWQQATGDPTITQVDIRRVKPKKASTPSTQSSVAVPTETVGDITSAVCEVAKYTVKFSDYVLPWSWSLSCSAVETLDLALARRRLVAFGGVMKDWHKALNLDDEIDGDLTHVDDEETLGEYTGDILAFWHTGYQQYIIE